MLKSHLGGFHPMEAAIQFQNRAVCHSSGRLGRLHGDDPTAVHKFFLMLPAFVFETRPVIPIDDAVRVKLESIAFREGLPKK
jgi:hypothetical protein